MYKLSGFRTIISAAVGLLGEVLRQFDVEIDAAGLTESIMVVGGALGAIYFRTRVGKPALPLPK